MVRKDKKINAYVNVYIYNIKIHNMQLDPQVRKGIVEPSTIISFEIILIENDNDAKPAP